MRSMRSKRSKKSKNKKSKNKLVKSLFKTTKQTSKTRSKTHSKTPKLTTPKRTPIRNRTPTESDSNMSLYVETKPKLKNTPSGYRKGFSSNKYVQLNRARYPGSPCFAAGHICDVTGRDDYRVLIFDKNNKPKWVNFKDLKKSCVLSPEQIYNELRKAKNVDYSQLLQKYHKKHKKTSKSSKNKMSLLID